MKSGSNDWLDAIAAKAGLRLDEVTAVLESKGIRPLPVVASPKRLTLRRLAFSGVKVGVSNAGPFEFLWDELKGGLWALVTEANLKGKSSIFRIVRWMLHGRQPDKLQDVRDWLHRCSLRFAIDDSAYEVRAEVQGGVAGCLMRLFPDGAETKLAAFRSDAEFESVMSGFFLRELGFDTVSRWRDGASVDGGKPVTHGWPSLSGAMFVGSDYSVLLGDVPPQAGLTTPLMQMYLGLPWVSTLTAAKTAEQGVKREQDSRDRRRKANEAARRSRTEEIQRTLFAKQAELQATPSDADVRAELGRLQTELAMQKQTELTLSARLEREKRACGEAEKAYADDRRDFQAHVDAAAAGAVFRMLDPSCCPRCDIAVTEDRRRREKDTHACSVCGEHLLADEDEASIRTNLEARMKASKEARDTAAKNIESAETDLQKMSANVAALDQQINSQVAKLASFGLRQKLELEVEILKARLSEASYSTEPDADDSSEAAVLKATVEETEKRVKELQEDLLSSVSERLTHYAHRFGMLNLNSAQLRGNGQLPLTKGGKQTSYSHCTDGEKLRLKVAAVLALISVGEAKGVGRHPGLLMLDSPGAQEVAQSDLDALISGLEEVSGEFRHLQLFIASLSSPAVTKHVAKERTRYSAGEEPLW